MEKFPDFINRTNVLEKLRENQNFLLEKTRELFTKTIRLKIANSERNITLHFDEKLWKQNRAVIVRELLERYGEIKIKTISGGDFVLNLASDCVSYDLITSFTINI